MLGSENEGLRQQVARLTAELEASRDQHGTDAATLRSELTLMAAEKTSSTWHRSDLAYMTELRRRRSRGRGQPRHAQGGEGGGDRSHAREAAAMAERHEAQIASQRAAQASQLASESTERELRGIIRSERKRTERPPRRAHAAAAHVGAQGRASTQAQSATDPM